MEEIKLVYYILGIVVILIGFIVQIVWMKFEIKQVKKDHKNDLDRVSQKSEASDSTIEKARHTNVIALREIYDQKIADAKNYAKGLFEQRADSIRNLQTKVDNIEKKLDNMPTQKSVDEINERLTNLIGLIMSQQSKNKGD